MKYAKMFGLLAVAAAALMAFAGIASATTLTEGVNDPIELGETIHAESNGATTLDGTINISCQKSTVHGEVTDIGGEGKAVSGPINTLTFTECGNHTVEVKKAGALSITHVGTGTHGTVRSTGAEVTVLTHSIFLGTRHCIYVTNGTDVGTLTSSKDIGNSTATLQIGSAPIPQSATDSLCGDDAEWTGDYKINTPDYLDVDP